MRELVQVRTQIHVLPKPMPFIVLKSLCPETRNWDIREQRASPYEESLTVECVQPRVDKKLREMEIIFCVFSLALEDPNVPAGQNVREADV